MWKDSSSSSANGRISVRVPRPLRTRVRVTGFDAISRSRTAHAKDDDKDARTCLTDDSGQGGVGCTSRIPGSGQLRDQALDSGDDLVPQWLCWDPDFVLVASADADVGTWGACRNGSHGVPDTRHVLGRRH